MSVSNSAFNSHVITTTTQNADQERKVAASQAPLVSQVSQRNLQSDFLSLHDIPICQDLLPPPPKTDIHEIIANIMGASGYGEKVCIDSLLSQASSQSISIAPTASQPTPLEESNALIAQASTLEEQREQLEKENAAAKLAAEARIAGFPVKEENKGPKPRYRRQLQSPELLAQAERRRSEECEKQIRAMTEKQAKLKAAAKAILDRAAEFDALPEAEKNKKFEEEAKKRADQTRQREEAEEKSKIDAVESKITASQAVRTVHYEQTKTMLETRDKLFSESDKSPPIEYVGPTPLELNAQFRFMRSSANTLVGTCALSASMAPEIIREIGRDFICLIDVSGSMAGKNIEGIQSALKEFCTQLGPRDRVCLMTFNDAYAVALPLKQMTEINLKLLSEAIRNLKADGGTEIVPALLLTILIQLGLAAAEPTVRAKSTFAGTDGENQSPLTEARGVTLRTVKDSAPGQIGNDINVNTFGINLAEKIAQPLSDFIENAGGRHYTGNMKEVFREGSQNATCRLFQVTPAKSSLSLKGKAKFTNISQYGTEPVVFGADGKSVTNICLPAVTGGSQRNIMFTLELEPDAKDSDAFEVNAAIGGQCLMLNQATKVNKRSKFALKDIPPFDLAVALPADCWLYQQSVIRALNSRSFVKAREILQSAMLQLSFHNPRLKSSVTRTCSALKAVLEQQSENTKESQFLEILESQLGSPSTVSPTAFENRKRTMDNIKTILSYLFGEIIANYVAEKSNNADFDQVINKHLVRDYDPSDRTPQELTKVSLIAELEDKGKFFHGTADQAIEYMDAIVKVAPFVEIIAQNTRLIGDLAHLAFSYLEDFMTFRDSTMSSEHFAISYVANPGTSIVELQHDLLRVGRNRNLIGDNANSKALINNFPDWQSVFNVRVPSVEFVKLTSKIAKAVSVLQNEEEYRKEYTPFLLTPSVDITEVALKSALRKYIHYRAPFFEGLEKYTKFVNTHGVINTIFQYLLPGMVFYRTGAHDEHQLSLAVCTAVNDQGVPTLENRIFKFDISTGSAKALQPQAGREDDFADLEALLEQEHIVPYI